MYLKLRPSVITTQNEALALKGQVREAQAEKARDCLLLSMLTASIRRVCSLSANYELHGCFSVSTLGSESHNQNGSEIFQLLLRVTVTTKYIFFNHFIGNKWCLFFLLWKALVPRVG